MYMKNQNAHRILRKMSADALLQLYTHALNFPLNITQKLLSFMPIFVFMEIIQLSICTMLR